MEYEQDFRPVVPDVMFDLNVPQLDKTYMINAKYDRIDHFVRYGQYVLKIVDDDEGLISMYIDEPTAFRVQEQAGLPIVPRDQIYESEYQGYLKAAAAQLEQWFED